MPCYVSQFNMKSLNMQQRYDIFSFFEMLTFANFVLSW